MQDRRKWNAVEDQIIRLEAIKTAAAMAGNYDGVGNLLVHADLICI